VALEQPLRHQGEIGRVLLLDLLPRLDRTRVVARRRKPDSFSSSRAMSIAFIQSFSC
jgi:hypothetical protein